MKQVVLIGDSVRIGYQSVVTDALADWAAVWAPQENGGTSRNVLKHLDQWVIGRRPQIVHLNAGLHDLARDPPNRGRPRITIDEYRENVRSIVTQIRRRTQAKVIWGTTTPVHEQNHRARKSFERLEADVARYNAAATDVVREEGVSVNDLYAVVMQAGRDRLLLPDGVHFNEKGYALLGSAVAEAVAAAAG